MGNPEHTATREDIIAQIEHEIDEEGFDIEGYPWGGDGSNEHEPIRAHVEAALIPTNEPYPPAVEQLLHIGDPREENADATPLTNIGLTQAHVPDLVRMTRDRRLNLSSPDGDRVWGPLYAVQALAQFDISEYIEVLLPLFDLEDEWIDEELIVTISTQGEAAFEPLQRYLNDQSRWLYGRGRAVRVIEALGKQSESSRARAIQILSTQLVPHPDSNPLLNGFFLASLYALSAVEALPTIRAAFERDAIDEGYAGDWEYAVSRLGQTPDPADPLIERSRAHAQLTRQREFPWMDSLREALSMAPPKTASKASKKNNPKKNKRKIAAASRKANRKKK